MTFDTLFNTALIAAIVLMSLAGMGMLYDIVNEIRNQYRRTQMGKHGRGGSIPEDDYVGDYKHVSVPDNPQCCTPEQLDNKVDQIDNAYEGDK